MAAMATSAILAERFGDKFMQVNRKPSDSRTTAVYSNNNSIESAELPKEIKQLITGSNYWKKAKENRYKKLIREGYLRDLLLLVKFVRETASKADPSHMFAKYASKAKWEKTLEFLTKLKKVEYVAAEVAKRLGTEVNKFIFKHVWRNKYALKHAVAAQEIGKSRERLFAWYCKNQEKLEAVAPPRA